MFKGDVHVSRGAIETTSFHLPGSYAAQEGGQRMRGALYVELWRGEVTRPWPVVMLHGGGQTGTCFTTKPDGGEGWAQAFARMGFAVYVVDEPARGRSPHAMDLDGPLRPVFPAETAEKIFTATAHHRLWPGAERHSQWPGSGRIGDPIFDRFYASQVPMLQDSRAAERAAALAIAALLPEIGPAILLPHSQGGTRAWLVADAVPERVKGILAVEPTGRPFYWPVELAPALGISLDTLLHPYGITQNPLVYDPPVADPSLLLGWRLPENRGRWRLPNLSRMPITLVTAEASYHRKSDPELSEYLDSMGVKNRLLALEELGIRGNGHMMMLERNSDEIASVLVDEIERWGL